jgi:hypothetical protein
MLGDLCQCHGSALAGIGHIGRLQGHVRRHQRAARDAQTHIDNAMTALEAHRNQFMNAIRERDEAQA